MKTQKNQLKILSMSLITTASLFNVIPAKAGIQNPSYTENKLDSRGNDNRNKHLIQFRLNFKCLAIKCRCSIMLCSMLSFWSEALISA